MWRDRRRTFAPSRPSVLNMTTFYFHQIEVFQTSDAPKTTVSLKYQYSSRYRHFKYECRSQPPPTNALLLAANDYIALLRVGPVAPPAADGTCTHLAQLYGALYNSYYKQVGSVVYGYCKGSFYTFTIFILVGACYAQRNCIILIEHRITSQ